jgi:hypothetical protein
VENPELITAEDIKAEGNAEVRRVMMGRFGMDRYIKEIGAERVSEDEFGILWRVSDGDTFHLAEVVNGTPEPDGVYTRDEIVSRFPKAAAYQDIVSAAPTSRWKTYVLPIPERNELMENRVITTCHEAVAWSYGKKPSEYAPQVRA